MFHIPDVEKEEESVSKKSLELDRTVNSNQKKFLCNSNLKKQFEKQGFLSSHHKGQIPNHICFRR